MTIAGGSMAVSSCYSLDCPVSWFVDMTKITAAVDDFLPLQPEVDKASLVAALLLIILHKWVLISMDNFRDAIFMCEHGICRPMRKVMGLLTWMGALRVIIKLPPSLVANGYGVYELYPYVVGFGWMFPIGIVFRHMIDIGSMSVRLAPVVLMLVLIAIRWNPLHNLIMFFYWICINIEVMQWSLAHFASSQIEVAPLHDKKVESVMRHLGLSPLQIFFLMTGNAVFNMAKLVLYFARSRLECFVRMIHR